jgi:hypothetical protein
MKDQVLYAMEQYELFNGTITSVLGSFHLVPYSFPFDNMVIIRMCSLPSDLQPRGAMALLGFLSV